MSQISEYDFGRLAAEWRNIDAPGPAPETIRGYVQSRTRLLHFWAAMEVFVAGAAAVILIGMARASADPGDVIAMASLAAIALLAAAASWINWYGVLDATARSTKEFIALSRERLTRLKIGFVAGWVLLAAEVTIFSMWISYKTAEANVRTATFSWGLLLLMSSAAVVFLLGLWRWIGREERRLGALQRDLEL